MRKFLTYMCAMLLMSSSAFSYYGSYSAYDLYQLASSGNIRAMQDAVHSGSNINATDANGQTAICYAIVNQDFVAYRNLSVLHADEHPSCVNRINKQDYESFKRGYELRGGTISSSFSLTGSTAAWTIAGIAAVGAGVAVAAGGGGGGGGGSSSDDKPDPTPTPTPTPGEQCKSFTLNQCPKNAICESCLASTGFVYKITGCKEGYALNNGCVPDPTVPKNYPLEQCDPNGRCISAMYGDVRMYRLISCNEDYVFSSDGLACEFICPGYTKDKCEETQYISAKCPKKDTYHICTERENTDHCSEYETEADRCTACYDSNQRKYKLVDGVCVEECKGMTQASCEREQYISEVCADNNKFHTCTARTHTEGCAGYDDYADKCTGCEEDYVLKDGICEKFCKGYTKEDCDIDTQYEASVCPDDPTHIYHTCKDRTFIKGCKNYNPKADVCSECEEGYKLSDGTCIQICVGYSKSCKKSTHYQGEQCSDDENYYKCEVRTNTRGCKDWVVDEDKCTSCRDGYELQTNGTCKSVCPDEYQDEDCDKLEYIPSDGICPEDSRFHKCKARTVTYGCKDYDLYADKCTSCLEDYELNGNACQDKCPESTKVACNNDTHWRLDDCPKDSRFHKCIFRLNTIGCTKYSETSDTCTECDGTSSTPVAGKCSCDGHYTRTCDKPTEYVSETCATAAGYHVCSPREHTEGCTDYDIYSDTCTSCVKADYYLPESHICTLRERKEGCEIFNEFSDTCLECTKATYYLPDDTKICTLRVHTDGCIDYNVNTDTCTECVKATHFLPDDTSICTPREHTDGCISFNVTSDTCSSCVKATHFLPDDTHICTPRVNTDGCIDYNEKTDTCTSCEKATHYLNSSNICTKRENTDHCKTFEEKSDKCKTCEEDYKLKDGFCVHICDGYQKESCDTNDFYEVFNCPDESDVAANMRKYRTCNERKNYTGCTRFVTTEDKCKECDQDHTLQGNGTCASNSSLCPGYTKSDCNFESQYMPTTAQGDVEPFCSYDNTYHRCVARDNSTDGCASLDRNNDKCLKCENGYVQNPENTNECIEKCSAKDGYQKEACGEDYYVPNDYKCPYDTTYHKCKLRTNDYSHCSKRKDTDDKCDKCEDGYSPNSSGVCEFSCPPEDGNTYQLECDMDFYYNGKTCVNNPLYHLCKERTNKAHCTDFNPNFDYCTSCESGYEVDSNHKCVTVCPGYQKEACDNKTHWTGDTCSTTHPDYHKCNLRTNRTYCTEFVVNADKCSDCKEGYEVNSSGSCVQICPGYFKTCENGWHVQKDASGNPVTCSATHPDYYKCELDKDAKSIPGCKVYADDKQSCKQCEDWYTLGGGGSSCNKCSDTIANCEKPFPDSCKCQTCAQGMKVDDEGKCVELENTGGGGSSGGGSGDDDVDYGSFYDETKGVDIKIETKCGTHGAPAATDSSYTQTKCGANQYYGWVCKYNGETYWQCWDYTNTNQEDWSLCEVRHPTENYCTKCKEGTLAVLIKESKQTYKCYNSGGTSSNESTCTSSCSSNAYYKDQTNCNGDEGVCTARTNYPIDECDTYSEFSDSCAICENGYGVGNNTGSNVPDSNGLCSEQSNSGVNGSCKLSCNLTIEYENQELNSECDGGKVFCAIRKYATNCGTSGFSQYADRCTACQSGVQLKKANSSDTDGYCLTTNGCQASPQACLENNKINTYYALVGTSISDDKLKAVYNSICGTAQTSEAVCIERTPIANCAQYAQLSDRCYKCKYDSSNKCLGVSIDNVCYADKYGLCEGNAGFSGEAAGNYGNTYSSKIVKVFDVSEDKENGQSVFVALDNKLDTFNAAIRQYNGSKSDSTQRIIVSGEFENAADITGAYNVHNGSLKGGMGTIEIIRNEESPTPITGAVKGLVGGNNYEKSKVIIDIDVNDATADGKHSFIAGMGKEVGAYKADDSGEINGIDLGSAEYGQHNADLINAGNVDISSGGSAQVYGMLGLRHADNVANHSEDRELGDFVNDSTGKINISAPNAKEIYGIRVNNLINKAGLSDKFSNVTNDGTINISGGSNVYGIAAKNANIYNNGNININATGNNVYGIHADRSNVENSGNITINSGGDNTYGIYAINGSTVKNSGVITINNNEYSGNFADGKSIYIDPTSYILNANTIISDTPLNTADFGGGTVLMSNGSNITAPEVSGTLNLSSDVTTGSNGNVYVMQNLINGVSQDLNVVSQSAMFTATVNDYGTTSDAVLTRKSFSDLISDKSLADYLDDNYTAGNAMSLFDDLKNLETLAKLKDGIKDFFGQNMLPRMTFEDMSMMREVNLDMNKNLFAQEGAFSFGGNVSPYTYDNNVGSIGRYALSGFNYGKLSYGLGISISDVSTYDDNQENSRNDRSFVMSMPIGRKLRGFEFITSPKIGYAYGEYTRNGFNNSYDGKVYKRMFALMNEARYPMDIGKMKFTPSAEFNMIGFNVKGSEEDHKPYNLRIPSQNHYSVEAGVGLLAEKNFTLYKKHQFKMNAGVAFYHEFANPYEIDVCMSEMDGMYRLHDEKRHSNRTVVRTGFDYEWGKDVELSASLLSNIDGEYRTDAVCDVKYHF